MENEFFKINQQCLQNLMEINGALASVETKGDSMLILYKIRITLSAVLEQMQKDNEKIEEEISIDNTKNDSKEEKDK